jgi:hypothetical protein
LVNTVQFTENSTDLIPSESFISVLPTKAHTGLSIVSSRVSSVNIRGASSALSTDLKIAVKGADSKP